MSDEQTLDAFNSMLESMHELIGLHERVDELSDDILELRGELGLSGPGDDKTFSLHPQTLKTEARKLGLDWDGNFLSKARLA